MHSTRNRRFRNSDDSYDYRAKNAQQRELMARVNATAHAPHEFSDEDEAQMHEAERINEGRLTNNERRNLSAGLAHDGRTFEDEDLDEHDTPTTTVATFSRLKREPGQPWGVRVPLPSNDANPGCTVTVHTRAGEEKRITLGTEVVKFSDAALFTIAGERKLADDGAKAEAIDYRRRMTERLDGRVPAGRYAVDGDDGTTDFYFVDFAEHSIWNGCVFVTLHTGGGDQSMSPKASGTILAKIIEVGAREASLRYGQELGHCGVCGRELTNEDSRERGIGPVCAGKVGW